MAANDAALDEMSGETMAKGMAGDVLVNAGVAQRCCCGAVCDPHLILIPSGSLGASCLWLFCPHLLLLEQY